MKSEKKITKIMKGLLCPTMATRKRTKMRTTTRTDTDTNTDNADGNEMVHIEIEEPIKNKQTTDTNMDTNLNENLYEEDYDKEEQEEDDDNDNDNDNENDNDNDNEDKVDIDVDIGDVLPVLQILPTIPTTCCSTPTITHAATRLLQAVYDNPTCAICLEVFESDDPIIFCSNSIHPHCFHQECSLDYLCSHIDGVHAPCPLCRQPFLLDGECCSSSTSTSNE